MQIKEYKQSIFLGIIAFILLNTAMILNLFIRARSSFVELIYLLSIMIGLIFFIGAFFVTINKNQELSRKNV